MKTLKIILLITGILSFVSCGYNIIFLNLPYQWFGFIAGALLIWIFFNINSVLKISKGIE